MKSIRILVQVWNKYMTSDSYQDEEAKSVTYNMYYLLPELKKVCVWWMQVFYHLV